MDRSVVNNKAALLQRVGVFVNRVFGSALNLRAGPGTNFDKVTSVPAGTAVTALGTNSDGSWVVVQVGGQYGWLKVEFLNQ